MKESTCERKHLFVMKESAYTYSGQLFDMHCHPGFSSCAYELLSQAADLGISGFGNVVTPQEYESIINQAEKLPYGFVLGAGLHPWWVENTGAFEETLQRACTNAELSPFIGEVGLDGSERFAAAFSAQKEAFLALLKIIAKKEWAVLSIHSSKAASEVLDLLEKSGVFAERATTWEAETVAFAQDISGGISAYETKGETPAHKIAEKSSAQEIVVIFHWFNGSGEELKRALDAGCYFSVNKRMLNTKRGRAYAIQIPEERLLLESDLPSSEDQAFSAFEWRRVLEETLEELALLRKTDVLTLGNILEQTSKKILRIQ